MNVARVNLSHGDPDEHRETIARLHEVAAGRPLAIMVDTRGAEIRIGRLKNKEVPLEAGGRVTLVENDLIGDGRRLPVNYRGLSQDVVPGDRILLDDGRIALVVTTVRDGKTECEVQNSGMLREHKGINVPGVVLNTPSITEEDRRDLKLVAAMKVDYVAVSFVRRAKDLAEVRDALGEAEIDLIAKIETRAALDDIEAILEACDGLMVARGDLGVEIEVEDLPLVQKRLIRMARQAAKPVITATQMLSSMVTQPRPTRAEVTDVANAIFDGTSALMLSEETAIGSYPVEAVRMMCRIARRAEREHLEALGDFERFPDLEESVAAAIGEAACQLASKLGAAAIITSTRSGSTARLASRFRPETPIIAATPSDRVYRKLALLWGVIPLRIPFSENTDEMIEDSLSAARDAELVRAGQRVVITAGIPFGVPGITNLIKVHEV